MNSIFIAVSYPTASVFNWIQGLLTMLRSWCVTGPEQQNYLENGIDYGLSGYGWGTSDTPFDGAHARGSFFDCGQEPCCQDAILLYITSDNVFLYPYISCHQGIMLCLVYR